MDIDGVLCTNERWMNTSEFWLENKWAKDLKVPYPFNPKCVKSLNRILTEVTDVEIILSSDWKKHWSLEELDNIFKVNGVVKSPIDKTPNKPVSISWFERNRMSDIEGYLRENNMINEEMTINTNWIIIDDLDIRQWLPDEYKDRFFLINDFEGISENGVVESIIEKIKKYETEETDKG